MNLYPKKESLKDVLSGERNMLFLHIKDHMNGVKMR